METQDQQPPRQSRTFSNLLEKRTILMKSLITVAFRLAGRMPPAGKELDLEVYVWEYALDDVPVHHLEECFRRAVKAKADTFILTATEIRQQYADMMPELAEQAREAEERNDLLLESGRANFGYISLSTFKERHNLPAEWKLGDAYPPESDLYQSSPPPMPEQTWACQTCHDARWVKEYPRGPLYPKLMPCPYCGQPVKER